MYTEFKGINLNREKIFEAIEKYCYLYEYKDAIISHEFVKYGETRNRVNVIINSQKIFMAFRGK